MKTKIALITGGFTAESEISFKSTNFVYQQLDHNRYDVYKVVVSLDGWYYETDQGQQYPIDKNDFTISLESKRISFDLAFIMLHGSPGEDGKLQGYLDMMGVPYTTCDALTSSLTMNKGYTKAILQGIQDLHLAQSLVLLAANRSKAVDLVTSSLVLPLFVKPNAGGSSVGMSKVKTLAELPDAINLAFDAENTGHQVIVEEFVSGREFSIGVYRRLDGSLHVLPASEVITSREFFDFEAKYTPGLTQEITPADLTGQQIDRIEGLVREIYVRLNCQGMVRVDFFLQSDTDYFYFIEINTVPGQTAQSFIPQQVRAAGMTETAFYTELIEVALSQNPQ